MENQETNKTQKPMSKTEVMASLAESTDLSKQQVADLFNELAKLIGTNLNEDGPGVFTVPGLMKIKVVRKPATEEREGTSLLVDNA